MHRLLTNDKEEIKKSIEESKEFIDNKEDILKELSELRKSENKRKLKSTKPSTTLTIMKMHRIKR